MVKFVPQSRRPFLCLISCLMVCHFTVVSAAPLFKTGQVIGLPDNYYQLIDFNDQDDILGTDEITGGSFIFHNGAYRALPSQGAPEITAQGSFPHAMNNADANGVVRIV